MMALYRGTGRGEVLTSNRQPQQFQSVLRDMLSTVAAFDVAAANPIVEAKPRSAEKPLITGEIRARAGHLR